MTRRNVFILLCLLLVGTAFAQKKWKPQKSPQKSWMEWNDKDATKMLNDSPCGQTQTDTNTAEMFYSPTSGGGDVLQSD